MLVICQQNSNNSMFKFFRLSIIYELWSSKPSLQLCWSPSITILVTANKFWKTETNKMYQNLSIATNRPNILKVNFCSLRGLLRWLTAGGGLNFRVRMLLKTAILNSKSGQHQISLHNINRKVMKIITKERNSLNLYYKKMYGNLYVNIDWEKKPVYSCPTPLKKSGNIFRGAGQLNTGQGKVEAFCVLWHEVLPCLDPRLRAK